MSRAIRRAGVWGLLVGLIPAPALAESLIPPAQPEAVAVARVNTTSPVVALTFDACPTRDRKGFDREVFEILRREQVPATVFMSGRWIEKNWREAKELADEPLIELGNHSYRHPAFSRMGARQVREEIETTDKLISALGRDSVGVRPPFGDWAGWLPETTGGKPVVLWDVVSGDAGGHVSADAMVQAVSASTRPGSIVIFHINGRGPNTKLALPRIIRRLRARGLRFVRVSELLGVQGGQIVKARPARYKKKEPALLAPALAPAPAAVSPVDLDELGHEDDHGDDQTIGADPQGPAFGSTPPG